MPTTKPKTTPKNRNKVSKPTPVPARRPARKPRPAAPVGDLRKEVESIVVDADHWLNTPNDLFAGRTPVELIGSSDEHLLREWVSAVKQGMTS